MDLGCTVIDIGAGTTSIGIFFDSHMIFADGVAVGGAHITNDIARGLTTSLNSAERLKTLYGNATLAPLDDRDMVDVPLMGEDGPENSNHLPKSQLIKIIQPRLEEIFELVRTKLEQSGFNATAGRRCVLTGGTSQLPGIRDVAQRLLDKQVRLGRPLRITRPSREILIGAQHGSPDSRRPKSGFDDALSVTGLAEATSGPSFATTAGLLAIAMQPDLAAAPGYADFGSSGMFGRLGQWVRQNL
jgi:cell division protein FtsA